MNLGEKFKSGSHSRFVNMKPINKYREDRRMREEDEGG